MKWMLDLDITPPDQRIGHADPVMLIGSCFTEHIGNQLQEYKFRVLQNPNGILFDPESVSRSLVSYIRNETLEEKDLVYLNELWHSWAFHSRFSGMDAGKVLAAMNESRHRAHTFLRSARWLIITLGSSFSYRLVENSLPVANCHRAPGQWFRKHLMSIEEINTTLDNTLYQLMHFNPDLRVIFTVSPVRHIRDGVVENNRSKSRLLEVVHHLVNKFDRLYYFPAYELVIDVLRDYRFYDVDLVHPNYQATAFVMEKFLQSFITDESARICQELRPVLNAFRHKPFEPNTEAHKRFLMSNLQKAREIGEAFPFLDLEKEIRFFSA